MVCDELEYYLKEIMTYKPFTKDEQIEFFKRLKNGEDVFEEIFKHNSALVIIVAKKYFKYVDYTCLSKMDIIQYGNIGLLKAIKTYDLNKDYAFSTWAYKVINNEIKNNIAQYGYAIKIDDTVRYRINKYQQMYYQLMMELERKPTIEELADSLKISKEKVIELQKLENKTIVTSLNVSVRENEDDFLKQLEDDKVDYLKEYENEETRKSILEAIDKVNLNENERNVIMLRYLNETIMTYEAVAHKLSLSKQRIFQIEKAALRKIKCSIYVKKLAYCTDAPIDNIQKIKKE